MPSGGHWDWSGGTAIIVGPGETVDTIARVHHVPARAIIDANGITSPGAILPGQRLVIPRYVPEGSGAKVAHAAAPRTAAVQEVMPPAPRTAAVQEVIPPAPRTAAVHEVMPAAPAAPAVAHAAAAPAVAHAAPAPAVTPAHVAATASSRVAAEAAPVARAVPPAPAAAPAPATHPIHTTQLASVAPAVPVHVAPAAPAAAGLPNSVPAGSGQTLLPVAPVHSVASGDTLSKIAHQYHVNVKDLAVANGIQPETRLSVGMKIAVPVKPIAAPKAAAAAKGQPLAAATKVQASVPAKMPGAVPAKLTGAEQVAKVQVVQTAEPQVEEAAGTAVNGVPAFRWPTRGRVIAGFGSKVNGNSNDGIDLAVPEGTAVRAADDGVVAYAGSELKGYGNLVLVRHSNGFVTAYANASELMVKRNDQVHKGQVIAKSGQTGTATNPQLHFEIRKNSSPVDPMQFLPADKTASAPL